MKLKHYVIIFLFLAVVNFTPKAVNAQEFDNGDPDAPIDTSVPLDGGISLLVAAGIAYGLKKRYDDKTQMKE
jgi:hypothetical protein